jgi:hypothetical protein
MVNRNRTYAAATLTALTMGALLFTGCRRDEPRALGEERPSETRPPEQRPKAPGERMENVRPQVMAALDEIAQARCDREMRCENVGPDKAHASRDACMQKMKQERIQGLSVEDCKGGVDRKELAECVSDIGKEECSAALDTPTRIPSCRANEICRPMAAPMP